MKIAIVTPVFPPYRGGIGTVAAHDAALLRARGEEVEVFTPQYERARFQEIGVSRLAPFYAWGNAAVLFSLIQKLKHFDVIHLHYPFFGSDILAAFACRLWRLPLVVTYHMRPKATGVLGATFWAYRHVLQPIIFSVARVVLVSSLEYAQEHGIRHAARKALPFSVDTQRFVPGNRPAARRRFELLDSVPTIVFVGGMDSAHYFKGVRELLSACAMLQTPWQLLVVGSGNKQKDFVRLAEELGIAHAVHFAGSLPYEDLHLAYQAADVHVLPSIDRSEAFGLVTLEAMACGIPSIVSDLPGVRSLVVPEATGLWVAPGDIEALAKSLERLCKNQSEREAFGRTARARAEKEYSDERHVVHLLEVYKSLHIRHE